MEVLVVDYHAENAAELFAKSLKETGFGVLKNHPISQDKVESIYKNWYDFFCTQEKHDFLYDKEHQDGYFPPSISEVAKGHSIKDIKEFFHVYPQGRIPESLKEEVLDYYEEANKLAQELLGWVQEQTPDDIKHSFSEDLPSMIDDSDKTLLRILHYPPLTGGEEPGAIRAAAHEDINLLTVLPAANEPGLQVKAKDGSWLDVPCEFGTLVINTGDMLQEATQGYYKSTSHRVINPEGQSQAKSRLSLPLFLHPRSEVVLSERYTAGSYLMERLKELGVL